jgi:hypothetical protein
MITALAIKLTPTQTRFDPLRSLRLCGESSFGVWRQICLNAAL